MRTGGQRAVQLAPASMKVPPKRKGNVLRNELLRNRRRGASMKVPPKRKGNTAGTPGSPALVGASMKVPPKRKGNARPPGACR